MCGDTSSSLNKIAAPFNLFQKRTVPSICDIDWTRGEQLAIHMATATHFESMGPLQLYLWDDYKSSFTILQHLYIYRTQPEGLLFGNGNNNIIALQQQESFLAISQGFSRRRTLSQK
jgi:hypothetical protein